MVRLAPTHLRPLAFGNSGRVTAGETVASIGYGLAFALAGPPSVTEGIISAVGRDLNDGFGPVWLQHQSVLNHGNSGGPLLDLHGDVIGVNTLSIDQVAGASGNEPVQGIFFAIPASIAQGVANRLISEAEGSPITTLSATSSKAERLSLAGVTITVPRGWLISHLSRQAPVLISRDQLVQMRVSTTRAARGQSLKALLTRMAHATSHARITSLRIGSLVAGHVRGAEATVTFAHKPGHLVFAALPGSRDTIVVVQVVVMSGATRGDLREEAAALASLRFAVAARG